MWPDASSAKYALVNLSKKFTVKELEEKKEELRRRDKDLEGMNYLLDFFPNFKAK